MQIVDKRGIAAERKLIVDLPCVYEDDTPMTDHVLVKQNASERTYKGTRIHIPEIAQQNPNVGVVVEVGPDVNAPEKEPRLCRGDIVTFGLFNAEPIAVDGEDYMLVSFYDIKLRRKVTYAVNG